MIHKVRGFSVVSEAHVFLEFSCFFYDPTDVGHLVSASSAFSKCSLKIWKFLVHIQLKPGLENFEHYFASVWDEYNCVVVWTFFGIAFLWNWSEYWPFPILWPLLSFPYLLAYWVQHFHTIIFQDLVQDFCSTDIGLTFYSPYNVPTPVVLLRKWINIFSLCFCDNWHSGE